MLHLPFKNAFEIAKDVHSHINVRNNYVLKLEQFQNPNLSLCWIGLQNYKWPAFSHGKYVFFNKAKNNKNLIFCGLHIERGLTKTDKESHLLSDYWTWHKFYRDWESGKIQEKLNEIEKYAGHSFIHINVSAGDKKRYDKLVFLQKDGTVQTDNAIEAGLLPLGHKYSDPKNAFEILLSEENPNLPFTWIDCYIGFYVALEEVVVKSEPDVWDKGLYVFDEYLT